MTSLTGLSASEIKCFGAQCSTALMGQHGDAPRCRFEVKNDSCGRSRISDKLLQAFVESFDQGLTRPGGSRPTQEEFRLGRPILRQHPAPIESVARPCASRARNSSMSRYSRGLGNVIATSSVCNFGSFSAMRSGLLITAIGILTPACSQFSDQAHPIHLRHVQVGQHQGIPIPLAHGESFLRRVCAYAPHSRGLSATSPVVVADQSYLLPPGWAHPG